MDYQEGTFALSESYELTVPGTYRLQYLLSTCSSISQKENRVLSFLVGTSHPDAFNSNLVHFVALFSQLSPAYGTLLSK